MADGSNSTMSEGDPPVAAQVVSGHLEMPGHLEMTPGQSPMETEEPSARARRRADEAEIAERGTPPKRPPPPDGNEGHPEMTGHLDIPAQQPRVPLGRLLTRRRAPSEAPLASGGTWGEPRERAPPKVAAREGREERDETGRMGGRAP